MKVTVIPPGMTGEQLWKERNPRRVAGWQKAQKQARANAGRRGLLSKLQNPKRKPKETR